MFQLYKLINTIAVKIKAVISSDFFMCLIVLFRQI